jgi:predicted metal-dependent hydrolase
MSTTSSTVNSDLSFMGAEGPAPLIIRSSPRARLMRLRVDPRTGQVLLTIPKRTSRRRAEEWAVGQREWVEAALAEIVPQTPLSDGSVFPFEGEPTRIEWSRSFPRLPVVENGRLRLGGPAEGLEARLLRWLKRQARGTLDRETRNLAARLGRGVERVGIGDPRSRWGSCSSSGSIRYSWRLILAPAFVRQATVAHEVAHLVHMNHGPAFHALVRELFDGDPGQARLWLRRNGASLYRIGRN